MTLTQAHLVVAMNTRIGALEAALERADRKLGELYQTAGAILLDERHTTIDGADVDAILDPLCDGSIVDVSDYSEEV